MTEPTQGEVNILDEAIDLAIRLQNDPDNPVAIDMIRAWRARGPRHEEIWAKVAKVHGASGLILSERRRIERRENLGLNRRNMMFGGLCFLGAAAGWSVAPSLILSARADIMTTKGERRRFDLPDGSVAILAPESALSLDFAAGRRSLQLLDGLCYFEAAPGSAPPFIVSCGAMQVTSMGSAFEVSLEAGQSRVSAAQGPVSVELQDGAGVQVREVLQETMWLRVNGSSSAVDRGRLDEGQVASWRDNLLIADQETVSALAARVGRWMPGRVVIADPFIGGQKVSGVYDLSDPLRALEAIVLPAGAKVRQISSFLTIISRV